MQFTEQIKNSFKSQEEFVKPRLKLDMQLSMQNNEIWIKNYLELPKVLPLPLSPASDRLYEEKEREGFYFNPEGKTVTSQFQNQLNFKIKQKIHN